MTLTLKVSRRFDHPPETVFDAWLNPAIAGKFLFATPTGTMVKAETDPRVGGAFLFVDRRDGQEVAHVGEYLEIDRPRRLVFSFGVPAFSAEVTTVAIDLAPADGGCELTLTHAGVLDEWGEQTRSGWTMILEGLSAALG